MPLSEQPTLFEEKEKNTEKKELSETGDKKYPEYKPYLENKETKEDPYSIDVTDNGVSLTYTNKENPNNSTSFSIKNNDGIREISEGHQGIIVPKDVDDVILDENEISNDENINHLNRILKSHNLPSMSNEKTIELSLHLSYQ